MNQKQLTDTEMFRMIMEEVRHIRKRLDAHIDDESKTLRCVQKEMGGIREDMASNRVKISGITAGIALIVSGVVAWIFSHLGK
jgi:hypothetical protein